MTNILPHEKVALFIDGANLHSAVRTLGFDIDYQKLRDLFSQHGILIRAFYYTALLVDQEFTPLKPLVDWLNYNGFSLVTKPAKEFTDGQGKRRVKGNMDIEIAVDMMEMADVVDHMILFSGDGDFRKLVETVQRRGCRVTVVSTVQTSPPLIADELRRQTDTFIDLADLRPDIERAQNSARRDDAMFDEYQDGDV